MAELKISVSVEEMVEALTDPRFLSQLAKLVSDMNYGGAPAVSAEGSSQDAKELPDLCTARQAAKKMGWSHQTFYRTTRRLQLDRLKVGSKWPVEQIRKEWERLTASLETTSDGEERAGEPATDGRRARGRAGK